MHEHHDTNMTEGCIVSEEEREIERLEKVLRETVDERDESQQAVSQIYYIVFGSAAEWSNNFGIGSAVQQITDAVNGLKAAVKQSQASEAKSVDFCIGLTGKKPVEITAAFSQRDELLEATGFDTFEQALEFICFQRDIADMADKACAPKVRDAEVEAGWQRIQAKIMGPEHEAALLKLRTQRDEWCAEFVKARNALLKIRDATEGCEDGSPDANPHDKLCNEIMGMVREVIADDDENRNDL